MDAVGEAESQDEDEFQARNATVVAEAAAAAEAAVATEAAVAEGTGQDNATVVASATVSAESADIAGALAATEVTSPPGLQFVDDDGTSLSDGSSTCGDGRSTVIGDSDLDTAESEGSYGPVVELSKRAWTRQRDTAPATCVQRKALGNAALGGFTGNAGWYFGHWGM